ncbi:MAG: hypothetical protein ABW360_06260 [Phenylobacterium sp.]
MRRRAVLSLIAACLLAACAHQTAPEAMAGMDWSFTDAAAGGGEAKLAFGAPNSDNVVVMLACQAKSGRIAVSTVEASPAAAITLTSRGRTSRHAAQALPNELGDGTLVEAQAPAADPTLASFAETGQLAVAVGGRKLALPDADRADARKFVDGCRA